MKNICSLYFLLFFIFSGSNLLASNLVFSEVPPLTPLRLLVSNYDQNYHILLAREQAGRNHYLIINDNGKVFVPELKQNSMIYFDGGSADLHLESGERVLIPSDKGSNILNTTLGPTILYADKAPIALKDEDVSFEQLENLNFSSFLAPYDSSFENPSNEWKDYKFLDNKHKFIVVRIRIKNKTDYQIVRAVKDRLNNLNDTSVRFLERSSTDLFGKDDWILLALPNEVKTIKDQIPDEIVLGFDTLIPDTLIVPPIKKLDRKSLMDLVSSLTEPFVPLSKIMTDLATINANSNLLMDLSENEKLTFIKSLLSALGDLENVHAYVHNFALIDTSMTGYKLNRPVQSVGSILNIKETEEHAFRSTLLDPIRKAGKQGYKILDKLDHPIARQIIVETANAIYGAGLSVVQGFPSSEDDHFDNVTYFDVWLNQLRQKFTLVDQLPQNTNIELLKNRQLLINTHSGSLFEQLKMSGEMVSLTSTQEPPIYFNVNHTTARLPTIEFGLPGDKQFTKRNFIQYIIEADKKSQKLADWFRAATKANVYSRKKSRFMIEGDYELFKLILGITRAPKIGKYAVQNFSEVEYTITVMEILQELIEIADTSLINNGTYAAVLEAASYVIKDVEDKKRWNRSEQERLSAKAYELQRALHHRMMKGFSWLSLSDENNTACAILLSPMPGQTTHNFNK
ncbi:MAG: hypothetical protein KDD40_03755 [Bdellovibrionales bacterium]|nr:hypothetical protein [Bdellovibrionales bacterium]